MKIEQKIETINDYNGRDYRTVWKHPRAVFEDKFEGGITRSLLTEKPGWFIDIGAGYGRVYPLFKKQGRKVVLLDYAMNLLEMAAKEYGDDEDVYFVAANAYHLPFKDEVFDGGISIRVFHHMNLPDKFMKEFGRIMRGGAEVIVEYANKRNFFRLFRRGRKSLQKDHEEYEPLHYGTHPAYFEGIANDAGFQIKRVLGTGFFPRFLEEKTFFLMPILSAAEKLFDSTLGRHDLGPLHFADVKKIGEENKNAPASKIDDILQCPACGGKLDLNISEAINCIECKRTFPKNGKILDLRYQPNVEK